MSHQIKDYSQGCEKVEGWKLKKGKIKKFNVSDNEIIGFCNRIFSTESKKTQSYKLIMMRAILDNLYNVADELVLTFQDLFSSFTELSWNLIVVHGLKQGGQNPVLQTVVNEFKKEHNVPDNLKYESLSDKQKETINSQVKTACKQYVVGAIYGDTEGTIYDFDRKDEYIKFNPIVYVFMQRFQNTLHRIANYEMVKFLEKYNKSFSGNFIEVVENVTKRANLYKERVLLINHDPLECFYCNKALSNGKDGENDSIELDHFIPWSFVYSDSLWNLVLSCKSCNNNKKASLPSRKYLDKIISFNDSRIKVMGRDKPPSMLRYREHKIKDLYNYAQLNGFMNHWEPAK